MAGLSGTKLRLSSRGVVALLLTFSAALPLSGCTLQALDEFRPEINISNNMVTDPEIWDAGYELTYQDGSLVDDEDRIPGSEVTGEGTGSGEADVTISSYSPIPYDVVASSDYTYYLKTQVVQPVSDLLSTRRENDSTLYSNIYFRCFHIGYNNAMDGADTELERSAAYDAKVPTSSTISTIGGNSVPDLVYSWLTKRYDNQQVRDRQVNRFLSKLQGFATSMTYDDARLDENMPSDLISMWGSSRVKSSCSTLNDVIYKVKSSPYMVVPNLQLAVLTGATSSQIITLNVTPSGRLPFQGGMTVAVLNKVCTSVSQFTTSTFDVTVTSNTSDDSSICWAYIDKYSATLIVLATKPGESLADKLGDDYSTIQSKITGTYSWNKTAEIASIMKDEREVSIIKEGLRGY